MNPTCTSDFELDTSDFELDTCDFELEPGSCGKGFKEFEESCDVLNL